MRKVRLVKAKFRYGLIGPHWELGAENACA